MNENNDSDKRIDNCLSGTGCTNVWELRMAFDFLRERLAISHDDLVSIKDVTREVSRRLYAADKDRGKE